MAARTGEERKGQSNKLGRLRTSGGLDDQVFEARRNRIDVARFELEVDARWMSFDHTFARRLL